MLKQKERTCYFFKTRSFLKKMYLDIPVWLTLWLAVLSDTGAALIVILNSLRLLE